jgi:hypothetical protein
MFVPVRVGAPYMDARVIEDAITSAASEPAATEAAGSAVMFVPVRVGAPYMDARVIDDTIPTYDEAVITPGIESAPAVVAVDLVPAVPHVSSPATSAAPVKLSVAPV